MTNDDESLEQMRDRLNAFWDVVEREARESKDSMLATLRLLDLYRRLDAQERALADQVVAEWALSDSEAKRYDATMLIGEFRVRSARPALREFAKRLARSRDHGARSEREKVEALVEELGAAG